MISVVVSVYNTGKYLERCVASLLAQTYQDYEILIVDDGSTDESGAVCDAQTAKSPRIRVFHKENGGLSSARNYGMERARGEWIIFPDPDDWVEPDYLEKLLHIQNSKHADMSICGFYRTYGEKKVFGSTMAEPFVMDRAEAMEYLIRPYKFGGYVWNKLFNAEVIRKHHLLFDEDLFHVQDKHFCVRYFQYCNSFAYDPVPLYHYSQDTGGVTQKSALNKRKLIGLLGHERTAELLKNDYPHLVEIEYCELCVRCLRYICMYYDYKTRDKAVLHLLTRTYREHSKLFYAAKEYTSSQKWYSVSHIAEISPWLYYLLRRMQGHYRHIKAVLNGK